MTIYLLDVNVLLAFCDSNHIHHDASHAWFSGHASRQWATCPITENGFLRLFGNPNYPNSPGPSGTSKMLRHICTLPGHHFWPDSTSILQWLSPESVISSKQITDLYLLGLAAANGGKLTTFDRSIPTKGIKGGAKALELLS